MKDLLKPSFCSPCSFASKSPVQHSCKTIYSNVARRTNVCKGVVGASDQLSNTSDVKISNRRYTISSFLLTGVVASFLSSSEQADAKPVSVATAEGLTILLDSSDVVNLQPNEKQVLNLNRRVQAQNRAPEDFPSFIRENFDVKIVGDGYVIQPDALIYKDFKVGTGEPPKEGQEVIFHYTGYNESGVGIDSSYRQGRPAQTQLGVNGLIPGFEKGISTMRLGGQRRIIVPPALGPPVGPSTFFSAKQCEVFDVELLAIRTCTRQQVAMFSRVVCE